LFLFFAVLVVIVHLYCAQRKAVFCALLRFYRFLCCSTTAQKRVTKRCNKQKFDVKVVSSFALWERGGGKRDSSLFLFSSCA
jgi:hypothetical protein